MRKKALCRMHYALHDTSNLSKRSVRHTDSAKTAFDLDSLPYYIYWNTNEGGDLWINRRSLNPLIANNNLCFVIWKLNVKKYLLSYERIFQVISTINFTFAINITININKNIILL